MLKAFAQMHGGKEFKFVLLALSGAAASLALIDGLAAAGTCVGFALNCLWILGD